MGWGYQSSLGHQDHGQWDADLLGAHINLKELLVPYKFLRSHRDLQDRSIVFEMDNTSAVHCILCQGSSKSEALLSISEKLFLEAHDRSLHLSALFRLRSYRGSVLLLAPWWPAQPWFSVLRAWCPNSLFLGTACLLNPLTDKLQSSLRLHAWNFSAER
ncbi:hypothetical protein E2C01_054294 [Portunus trituberculatus]|uniref:Uncharacterized protein n=1 Tax=Portunus trituberculatus TaxID=210409 RepID=A0A5B7GSD2_PORTR|nr:hypothetical protein [Portunus trituberculatus]